MDQLTPENITEQVNQANLEFYQRKEFNKTHDLFIKICKCNPEMTQKIKAVLIGKAEVVVK